MPPCCVGLACTTSTSRRWRRSARRCARRGGSMAWCCPMASPQGQTAQHPHGGDGLGLGGDLGLGGGLGCARAWRVRLLRARAWRLWASQHSQSERPRHVSPSRCLECAMQPPSRPPSRRLRRLWLARYRHGATRPAHLRTRSVAATQRFLDVLAAHHGSRGHAVRRHHRMDAGPDAAAAEADGRERRVLENAVLGQTVSLCGTFPYIDLLCGTSR